MVYHYTVAPAVSMDTTIVYNYREAPVALAVNLCYVTQLLYTLTVAQLMSYVMHCYRGTASVLIYVSCYRDTAVVLTVLHCS
jgi:hypothetical protein